MQFVLSITHVPPLIIVIISIIFLLGSIVFSVKFIIQSYCNYEYIAIPKQMEDYYNQLCKYYASSQNKDKEIEKTFQSFLISDYCKCCETNTFNNERRSAYLYNARTHKIEVFFLFYSTSD